ncbi:MAG: hypothetical protein ABL971_05295 [Vicinamibacterales bacterium]
MEVYLVPIGQARYELYSEQADAGPPGDPDEPQTGLLARARLRFAEMLLAAADRQRAKREGRWTAPVSRMARVRDWITAWVAERVEEEELHWALRRIHAAVLVHPADMDGEFAMATVRRTLAHDRRRHWRWAVAHGILFVAGGLFAVIPGPNLIAYYFAFRMFGHWLSARGAAQGLTRVSWSTRASEPLAELGEALLLAPHERRPRVAGIAAALGLTDLGAFIERVTLGRA